MKPPVLLAGTAALPSTQTRLWCAPLIFGCDMDDETKQLDATPLQDQLTMNARKGMPQAFMDVLTVSC